MNVPCLRLIRVFSAIEVVALISVTTVVGLVPGLATTGLAATFSSGSHIVELATDGVYAIGQDTAVVINDSTESSFFRDSSSNRYSVLVAVGAHVIINDGQYSDRIGMLFETNDEPLSRLDIHNGTFDHIVSAGTVNIYGGTFHGQVIGGFGNVNVYGGTFGELGYDSDSGVQINVYGRRFDFDEDEVGAINDAYPAAQFPLDQIGETFSMTDGQCCLHGKTVIAQSLSGDEIRFRPFLDGPSGGNINLIVVPEPPVGCNELIAFLLALTCLRRNRIRRSRRSNRLRR